ncbi:MAG: hypothetical protein KDK65_03335 [Chlamydiia bacterium]|nr:hypothetical protein [Chlamydiia bacterium]
MSDLKARKIVKEFYRNRKDPTQGTIAKIERLREALLYRRRDRGRAWGAGLQPKQLLTRRSRKKERVALPRLDENYTSDHLKLKVNREGMDLKTLFHFFGNGWGGSSLEGHDACSVLKFVGTFFNERGREGMAATLMQAASIADAKWDPEKLQHLIEEGFQTKKPLLIPTGWIGDPGHAMYLEVIPEGDEATLRIYNLGGGVADFHDTAFVGFQEKASPYVEWKGITKKRLTDLSVLKVIQEYETQLMIPGTSNKTNYGAADIYQRLRGLLEPREVKTKAITNEEDVMAKQMSGICSWRSLCAFLRTHIADLPTYKQVKVEIKLQALLSAIATDEQPNWAKWRLIRKSRQKLAMSLTSPHTAKHLTAKDIRLAKEVLEKVEQWEKHWEDHAVYPPVDEEKKEEETREKPPTLWAKVKHYFSRSYQTSEESLHGWMRKEKIEKPTSFVALDPLVTPSTERLQELLQTAKQMWVKGNDRQLHYGLKELLRKLPSEVSWCDQEKAQETSRLLHELTTLFFKSCHQVAVNGEKDPEWFYLLYKSLVIQKQLIHLIDSRLTVSLPQFQLNWYQTGFTSQQQCDLESWQQQNKEGSITTGLFTDHFEYLSITNSWYKDFQAKINGTALTDIELIPLAEAVPERSRMCDYNI